MNQDSARGVCPSKRPLRRNRMNFLDLELDGELDRGEDALICFSNCICSHAGSKMLRHKDAIRGIHFHHCFRVGMVECLFVLFQQAGNRLGVAHVFRPPETECIGNALITVVAQCGIDRVIFGIIQAMMDLNSLVAFARVVEAGSFAEAARRMKMPTSTLSRRVAELENQLGVRLLDRSTRRLRLTDVGAELLEHAALGAQVSDAVLSIASNYGSTVSGRLRLSAPPSIADSFLAPLIIAFQARYPEVRVQVLIAERAVDHIADGVD